MVIFFKICSPSRSQESSKANFTFLDYELHVDSWTFLLHLIRREKKNKTQTKKNFWSIKTKKYTNKQFNFNDGYFKMTHDSQLILKTSEEILSVCFLPDLF